MKRIEFSNQCVIVTGAGGGIGREIARMLATRGAQVVVNDYGGDLHGNAGISQRAEAVVGEIELDGGRAIASAVPVGSAEAAEAIASAALAAFGRIDAVVNNAGVTDFGASCDIDMEKLERVMRINYWGAFNLMRAAWPAMRQQQYGRILNVMSSAILGIGHLVAYSASKSALIGLSAEAAIEGKADNILVNGLFPAGYSRMVEGSDAPHRDWMKTHFQPEKVAAAVTHLISRQMRTSGEIYTAGAGRVARVAFAVNDGFFDQAITPEKVAEHFDQVRDMSQASIGTSCWDLDSRYLKWAPWTGGDQGVRSMN